MAHTPWGDIRVNDAHVHFFSREFYSVLARQRQLASAEALGPLLDQEIPPADPAALAKCWVDELDANHVRRACLIASVHGDEHSVALAVSAYPDRFFGYFMLDPLQPDAPERVERAAAHADLHCMCLFPAMHRYSITDPRVKPVLEAAATNHLAVFVHCGALSVGVRKKLGLPSPFDMRMSNPLDLQPVALQFPELRFVIPHFGAGLFREALMLADMCPNVWFDTSSTNRWMKYEGLKLRSVFGRAIDVLGVGRLMFGTDSSFFPRGWNREILDEQAKALYELGLTPAEAEQILAANLEQFLAPRQAG
ncbi:MAG TPA: amidohydrolase family protein [Bryobacteraceae bacterium]|nr:amidohydrolase family protein [Bryobacteraceae bacterium]